MPELNDQKIEKTVDLLINEYDLSTQRINNLLGIYLRNQVEALAGNISPKEKLKLLLLNQGSQFFAGSADETRNLRKFLLKKQSKKELRSLFTEVQNEDKEASKEHYARVLAEKHWHKGGNWPKKFMRTLELPIALSGTKADTKPPDVEDVEPKLILPDLVPFQVELKGADAHRIGTRS